MLDELFGHVPGAYTDARKPRPGRFATAGGGTLLLDDIQTIDLGTQKQLLQVLDRRTYSPVGCDRVMTVACRIILAMTESPDALMKNGVLLKDLRYRFGECGIRIPRLAERRDEIPLHAQRALQGCPIQTAVNGPTGFTDAALAFLCACAFDGNVRQLQGIVLRAYLIAGHSGAAQIGVEHFPEECRSDLCYTRHGNPDVNRRAVERALSLTGGNARAAAELLGVSRTTLNAMRGVRLERRTGFR